MSTSDDDTKFRILRSELVAAGWPDSSSYTQGFKYSDKIKSVQVHEAMLDDLADRCMRGWIERSTLLILGQCAKDNLPRALNLLGLIPSGEGGETTFPPLPNFWQWPVLSTDPESGG